MYHAGLLRQVGLLCGCLMALATLAAIGDETTAPPSGASAAWTSDDPMIAKARQLVLAGHLSEAQGVLASPSIAASSARDEMLEIITRIRQDYSLDASGLLAKLRPAIPDITSNDLERWRSAGQVQHRIIDGNVMYFRREPANIFRFCDEAKRRREQHATRGGGDVGPAKFVLTDHFAKVLAEAKRSGKSEVVPVKHRITYTVTLPPTVPGARRGSMVRCWLPYPQENRQQKDGKLIPARPGNPVIAPNGIEGGQIRK